MVWVYVGIAVLVLFLCVRLAKFINGPKMEQAKTERRKAWYDFRLKRRERGFFRRRRGKDSQ